MMLERMIKQIFPHNVHYSTTLLSCWKELCKSKVQGFKETGNQGRMTSEEPHVNWHTEPPLADLGPLGWVKAKAIRQSEGTRERKAGGSLHVNEDGTVASPGS